MYKRIIITRFGGLGDIVMLTPILRGIKEILPNCKLTVVGEHSARLIIEGCPFVDEFIGFDNSYKTAWTIIKKIWRADVVYLMDISYRVSLIHWLARVKRRVGLPYKRKFFLTDVLSEKNWMNYAYEPVIYADFLKDAIGIDITKLPNWDELFYPECSEKEKERVTDLLSQRKYNDYIVCSLETAVAAKDWPIEYWTELFEQLDKMEKSVVVVGTVSKQHNDLKLTSNVIDLRGKTNTLELGEVIRQADIVVNGCSFPVHVANAVNTPVIGLYGSQPDWRGRPQRIYASLCADIDCAPCDYLFNSPGWCKEPKCMYTITVNQVIKTIEEFYKQGKPLGDYCLIKGS